MNSRAFVCVCVLVLFGRLTLLAGATPGPAAPQMGTTITVGEFRVIAETFVPDRASRGFAPVTFRVSNDGVRVERLDVSIEAYWSTEMARSEQEFSVTLEPGETRFVERLVPIERVHGRTNYGVDLRSGNDRQRINLPLADERGQSAGRVIVLLGENQIDPALMITHRSSLPKDNGTSIRGVFDSSKLRGSSSRYADQGAMIFSMAFDEMPSSTAGWSSVDTVFLEVNSALQPDPRWGRLLEWVRQGGQLVLIGDELESRLRGVEGFEAMMARRLEVELDEGSRGIAAHLHCAVTAYRAGFGVLVCVHEPRSNFYYPRNPKSARGTGGHLPDTLKLLDRTLPVTSPDPSMIGIIGRADVSMGRSIWNEPLPDDSLPIRPVLAMLALFALLVGPGSVIYSRRKKRPGLLFLSVPVLSLATTALIVVFGLVRQGFRTEGFAHSLAIIDQVEHQATAAFRRNLVLGTGGSTLRPLPGTTVFVPDLGDAARMRTVEMDGNQLILSGDFLPVRERTSHVAIAVGTTRARLEWSPPEGDKMTVTNALGVDLEALDVRAPDGAIYGTTQGVPKGASATLTKRVHPAVGDPFGGHWSDPLFSRAELPPCGYLATAASAGPGVDDCSVEMTELKGLHGIVGLMDPNPVKWTR